ncbi:hypothetical protein JHK85_009822 [Glycine max]|nr:hypothetical protein JHK85_009822 [Glycine max]
MDRARHRTTTVYGGRAQEGVLEEETSKVIESRPSWKVFPGQAFPLGVSEVDNCMNFAIFSQHATAVTLCLVLPERGSIDALDGGMIEMVLDPDLNKTGDIWHICIEDLPRSNVLYGYRIDGPGDRGKGHRFDSSIVLVDPYAKLVEGRRYFGDISLKLSKFLGTYDFDSLPFDWGENYKLPNISEKDLVIYEMNVRAFTSDESSGLDSNIRGSYLGVIEKVICVRYASAGGGSVNASREFKQMVKAVTEYHVDGFRFDLASVLCRGIDGSPINAPPLIRAIAKDAVLSRCKIIAEPWDCGGLYLVGSFPNWDRGKVAPYVDELSAWSKSKQFHQCKLHDLCDFDSGDSGVKGSFATRVAGSSDLYRHNKANGEGGKDGSNDNFSWNCGFEGETDDASIRALRSRQMKNFHLALMISQLDARKSDHFRFFSKVIKYRHAHEVFSRENFLNTADTNLKSPDDFVLDGVPSVGNTYNIAPYSSILLEAKF